MKIEVQKKLEILDLSDPENGVNAINLVVDNIQKALSCAVGWPKPEVLRYMPIVSIKDCFDNLYIPSSSLSRSSKNTIYINDQTVLRTHTSAHIPEVLRWVRKNNFIDCLFLIPGVCFRRQVVSKTYRPELHQMDIVRIRKGISLNKIDLKNMVDVILNSTVSNYGYKVEKFSNPYILNGFKNKISIAKKWQTVCSSGQLNPRLFLDAGFEVNDYSGFAIGIGLDRLVMLIKKIGDVRVFRSSDLRIQSQMTNLNPYRPIFDETTFVRDISIVVSVDVNIGIISKRIIKALKGNLELINEIRLVAETSYESLSIQTRKKIGIKSGQKNLLVRLIFNGYNKVLTRTKVNQLCRVAFLATHQAKELSI